MKIYIDDRQIKKDFEKIKGLFPQVKITNDLEDGYDAEGIVVFPDYVKEENLQKYPNLKWVQLFTAGFDTLNLDYLKDKGILLTNARGVYSKTIAEDVITKILALNRNVRGYYENMKKGKWELLKNEYEITGATVGIIGTGSIGMEIAKRLKAFETLIVGYRRKFFEVPYFDKIFVGDEGLNRLLQVSDYVIIAIPLSPETFHLIDKEKLALMKETALLINIARGDIIKQEDLINALLAKKIRGAGLDVTTPEPLPEDNLLWQMDNVIITPHNSVSSPLLKGRLVELVIENIGNYVYNKDMLNIVNL